MPHTPGPWAVSQDALWFAEGPSVRTPARHIARMWGDTPEDQANARLIAAAPELLEALRAIVEGPNNSHLADDQLAHVLRVNLHTIAIARAAIVKATKEEP